MMDEDLHPIINVSLETFDEQKRSETVFRLAPYKSLANRVTEISHAAIR
jgi:hypothetical protein